MDSLRQVETRLIKLREMRGKPLLVHAIGINFIGGDPLLAAGMHE